ITVPQPPLPPPTDTEALTDRITRDQLAELTPSEITVPSQLAAQLPDLDPDTVKAEVTQLAPKPAPDEVPVDRVQTASREPARTPAPGEPAAREPVAREPVAREPAAREPARTPAAREPASREPPSRAPVEPPDRAPLDPGPPRQLEPLLLAPQP